MFLGVWALFQSLGSGFRDVRTAMDTHRPHSSSFWGFPYGILNMNPQKGATLGPMDSLRLQKLCGFSAQASRFRVYHVEPTVAIKREQLCIKSKPSTASTPTAISTPAKHCEYRNWKPLPRVPQNPLNPVSPAPPETTTKPPTDPTPQPKSLLHTFLYSLTKTPEPKPEPQTLT